LGDSASPAQAARCQVAAHGVHQVHLQEAGVEGLQLAQPLADRGGVAARASSAIRVAKKDGDAGGRRREREARHHAAGAHLQWCVRG
jgi:hypothetical protein